MLSPQMTQEFSHILCQIGAIEAEEVGFENLFEKLMIQRKNSSESIDSQ